MKEVLSLSIDKLKQIVELKTQIARLESQLESLAGSTSLVPVQKVAKKKRTMSAAARKKISLAAKARWAKFHAAKAK